MKLYDKKEIGAILKRATENSSAEGPDTTMGLSIEELRQLASDVGIDPEQITQAVAEMEMDSGRGVRTFWGGPFSFNSQILVDEEITAGQWEEMLISIRDFFQSKGEVTTRESVWEWSSPWGTTNTAQVTALKNSGKTKISTRWNGPLTAVPFYIPVPLVAIASVFFASEFLALTAVPGVGFTLMATGIAFLLGRWALCRHLDKGMKKLHQMVAGLENIADRQNSPSELDVKLTEAKQIQAEKIDPLLKIPKEENHNEPDNGRRFRKRSGI